ncbi:integrase core domain-containing protein, partial [Bacteroides caecigallinarum]
ALHRLDGKGEENVSGLIHHSDRGVQYASDEYVSLLHENNICISMTENGDPKENAIAERVNQTVKNELLKDIRFHSLAEIKDALKVAVEFYNTRRPHMSVDMMTPEEA